jgi:hypothetical protein
MSQVLCSQPRSTARSKHVISHTESSIHSTAARNDSSTHGASPQRVRRAAAADLRRLLDADAVDLRSVGDAIRIHPELESLILKLCDLLVLTSEDPASSVEEAAIVLGKERLRIVVQAWSANRWTDKDRIEPQTENLQATPSSQSSGAVPAGVIVGRPARFLSSEFSAEILELDNLFQSARRDVVSFLDTGGESCGRRLDRELRQAAHLTDLLVRDLLSLISLTSPAIPSPRQEPVLQDGLQVRR